MAIFRKDVNQACTYSPEFPTTWRATYGKIRISHNVFLSLYAMQNKPVQPDYASSIPSQSLCFIFHQLICRSIRLNCILGAFTGISRFQSRIRVGVVRATKRCISLIVQGTVWNFQMPYKLTVRQHSVHPEERRGYSQPISRHSANQ